MSNVLRGENIRRGQLIVPFGIGAILDLANDTVMLGGLDYWPNEITSGLMKEAICNEKL